MRLCSLPQCAWHQSFWMPYLVLICAAFLVFCDGDMGSAAQHLAQDGGTATPGESKEVRRLATWVSQLSGEVLPGETREQAVQAIDRDLRTRRAAANRASDQAWQAISDRATWEVFRDQRLARLRASLGQLPPASSEPPPRMMVTRQAKFSGYEVRNILFESRPGDWVAGHLYAPLDGDGTNALRPGLVIVPSHHRSKEQGELQEMGQLWARAGCYVLVIDPVGYGERRAHPFRSANDYRGEFAVSRQDYYHRYDSGIQLMLVGDSLMGWFVHDLHRCIDVLLTQPNIDRDKLIILGAVAGGGDPAAIAAALDPRVDGCVPFNFGGPQPESPYPLPEDSREFNYLVNTYWDSTRGLYRTAADGFFHWVITSAIAPRRLVHAHEFAWDQQRDPVWKRYRTLYGEFYGVPGRLAYTHGAGSVRGRSPESTHCTNIGRVHRKMIHEAFARWYGIHAVEADAFQSRSGDDLLCFTPQAIQELKPKSQGERIHALGKSRSQAFRTKLAQQDNPAAFREALREAWTPKLGRVEPWRIEQVAPLPAEPAAEDEIGATAGVVASRYSLQLERGFSLPVLLLQPKSQNAQRHPVVLAIAQQGKAALLRTRGGQIAQLLGDGLAVCLVDVRGTGELKLGNGRDRSSGDVNRSVNLLLFGETMLGQRLGDVRSVVAWLRGRDDIDPKRVALWGASPGAVNREDTDFRVPRAVEGRPSQSEPAGGMLALLAALYDDDIAAVAVDGGLATYLDVLPHYQVYIPHDAMVPGALTCGDWCDVAAALAPRPLRMQHMVDGLNRPIQVQRLNSLYEPAAARYCATAAADRLQLLGAGEAEAAGLARWLAEVLQ